MAMTVEKCKIAATVMDAGRQQLKQHIQCWVEMCSFICMWGIIIASGWRQSGVNCIYQLMSFP